MSIPSTANKKHPFRNRSASVSHNEYDNLEYKAPLWQEINERNTSRRSSVDIKSTVRRTLQGVKNAFGTREPSLKKSASTPNIAKLGSFKSRLSNLPAHQHLSENFLTPTSYEPRRRKVSWARKIENWLDNNKSSNQSGQRKVSWASSTTRSFDNSQPFLGNELRNSYYSDGQLNDVSENQTAEQIALHYNEIVNQTTQGNINSEGINTQNTKEIVETEEICTQSDIMDGVSAKGKINYKNHQDYLLNPHRSLYSGNNINNDFDLNNNNKLSDSINQLTYALDDLNMLDEQRSICKKGLQKSLSGEPRRRRKSRRSTSSDNNTDSDEYVSIEDIQKLIEEEIHYELDGKSFNSKLVTLWCKDISNSVRDKLKFITKNKKKVVVTTYIGSKINDSGVHVSVKCQKQMNTDDFLTVALEGEDMVTWVTLLLADY